MASLRPSRLDPGQGDVPACLFSQHCRFGTPEYSQHYANDRALRMMGMTPVFREPKVFSSPVKAEHEVGGGRRMQAWFPWQACTNCIAARAKGRCLLWYRAQLVQKPLRLHLLQPGHHSVDDVRYARFSELRDNFLAKEVGYFGPWLCRDGTTSLVRIVCILLRAGLTWNVGSPVVARQCTRWSKSMGQRTAVMGVHDPAFYKGV
jgi:hypothetical protein